ncbi:hypothetical protein B9Z19DRAFT_1103423 [Tuber borchii]|uniref:t-SNARE coiled-coil homology domain-containing protein n=1 Tax=Tuber borchii TaxID=42251 RepID=A0A2T6ZG56_TUBBO|nr:hypothetical protein B9Z19DRAFT_1103423 [Tuber borchii]
MTSTTADRLQLLQEHIRLSLIERKRALSLRAEPDTRNTHEISRSLDTLHQGIEQLEKEQQQLEVAGDLSSQGLREREDVLIRLRSQYDDLHAQFTSTDTAPSGPLDLSFRSSSSMIAPGRRSENPIDEHEAREALMGSRETPSALRKGNKTVRFSDTLVNTDGLDNHQVLQLHRRVLDEQDESLDRLSQSIRNQRELSIQIGDELDSHVQLLDECGPDGKGPWKSGRHCYPHYYLNLTHCCYQIV